MSAQMYPNSELRRLEYGPIPEESIPGIGTVLFSVRCNGNAEQVLNNVVSVMRVVCSLPNGEWPDDITWRTLLPQQFVSACADEMTAEEADRWLHHWQTLTQEQREAEERIRKWSLANWLYWLEPSQRLWQWWDAKIIDPSTFIVCFAVQTWPFGSGAIAWLFCGAGAVEVAAVNQRIG